MFFTRRELPLSLFHLYGVHIGHSRKNTVITAAWMVHSFRQLIAIINLKLTIRLLKDLFFFVNNIIAFLGPIWFVNFNPLAKRFVKACALFCGEFSVTTKWVRGSVSNFRTVFRSFRTSSQRNWFALPSRLKRLQDFFSNWHFTRFVRPRGLFLSNLDLSDFAVRESILAGVASLGIIDTNVYSPFLGLPTPGNDESIFCIVLYNDLVTNYILFKKFTLVLMWFLNVRAAPRLVSFYKWITNHHFFTKKERKFNIFSVFNKFSGLSTNENFNKGSSLFFSGGGNFISAFEHVTVSSFGIVENFSYIADNILKNRVVVGTTLRLSFLKKMLAFKSYVYRKNFFSEFNFKRRFLLGRYSFGRFVTNAFTIGQINLNSNIKFDFKKNMKSRTFFLNLLPRLYFFTKYEKFIVVGRAFGYRRRFLFKLRRSYLYRLFSAITGRLYIRNSDIVRPVEFGNLSFLRYRRLLRRIRALIVRRKFYYKRRLWFYFRNRPWLKRAWFWWKRRRAIVLKRRLKLNTMYYKKSLNIMNNKLKYFMDNFVLDRFVNYIYIWNIRSLVAANKPFVYFGWRKSWVVKKRLNRDNLDFFLTKEFQKGLIFEDCSFFWLWR